MLELVRFEPEPQGLTIQGDWFFYFDDGTVIYRRNKVVQTGLEFLAAIFAGEQTADVGIYFAFGTDSSPVDPLLDKTLKAEGTRQPLVSKTRSSNVVRLRTFFLATEGNGDWQEVGIYVTGTTVLNSGILLNRLVTPISKSDNQVMTAECRLSFLG